MRITKLKTHQGFAAEVAAASTITVASSLGIPLSTTHTISTSIVGVGVVRSVRAVSWGITMQSGYGLGADLPDLCRDQLVHGEVVRTDFVNGRWTVQAQYA